MKAVILVGGLATRLRPLTLTTPKAMVPVLNMPFLEHVLRRLGSFGIKEVVLALSHLAPVVESYFGDGQRLGLKVSYVLEKTPLGTAGAARNALGHINNACLVMNGDIYSGLDIPAMLACHERNHAKVTIALTGVDNPCAYGLVETGQDGGVRCFREKPSPQDITSNMINAGTYVIEPEVLAAIPPDTPVSFEREVFPTLLSAGERVYSFSDASYWIDIGTPSKYHQLSRDLLNNVISPPFTIHAVSGATVDASAKVYGPVSIGPGTVIKEHVVILGPTVIGPGCSLEPGTIVNDSIIWQNVVVGSNCRIESSIIADGCRLGSACCLSKCVMGNGITLPPHFYQTSGQIWPVLILAAS